MEISAFLFIIIGAISLKSIYPLDETVYFLCYIKLLHFFKRYFNFIAEIIYVISQAYAFGITNLRKFRTVWLRI